MADITEAEQWDTGVYQLETTDPVQGGADGVDNIPHKALANRTVWLKAQLALKALLGGSATQTFKVATATLTDEAVNKGQSEAYTDNAVAGLTGLLSIDNFLHIQDQKPSGTAGGATPVSNNVVRDLNTVIVNNILGASLSNNQVTLPIGKYYIEAVTEIVAGVNCIIKINNVTDTVKELQGVNNYSNVTYTGGANPSVSGIIDVLSSSKVFEVLMYIESLNANNLGVVSPDGTIEIYTDLKIWKVS